MEVSHKDVKLLNEVKLLKQENQRLWKYVFELEEELQTRSWSGHDAPNGRLQTIISGLYDRTEYSGCWLGVCCVATARFPCSDLEICVSDGKSFRGHKLVLLGCSDNWGTDLTTATHLDLKDMCCYSVELLLKWIYTDELQESEDLTTDIYKNLLTASQTYHLDQLSKRIESSLVKSVNSKNCKLYHDLADKFALKFLSKCCLQTAVDEDESTLNDADLIEECESLKESLLSDDDGDVAPNPWTVEDLKQRFGVKILNPNYTNSEAVQLPHSFIASKNKLLCNQTTSDGSGVCSLKRKGSEQDHVCSAVTSAGLGSDQDIVYKAVTSGSLESEQDLLVCDSVTLDSSGVADFKRIGPGRDILCPAVITDGLDVTGSNQKEYKTNILSDQAACDDELSCNQKSLDMDIDQFCSKDKHLHSNKSEVPYFCGFCGKHFTSQKVLQTRMSTHASKSWENHKKCLSRQKKLHKCDVCEKAFDQQYLLVRHNRMHTGERPFVCHICQKGFVDAHRLRRHIVTHCHAKNDHLEQISSPILNKSQICEICAKVFFNKYELIRHQRIHTRETKFKCDICDKVCKNSEYFERHLKIHTMPLSEYKEIIKIHKCNVCGKGFRLNNELVAHIRIHTGETPFKCDVCNKEFKRKRYLKSHAKVHHKD